MTANVDSLPYLYFDLTFIDWDHSLVAAFFWSAVWAALWAWKSGGRQERKQAGQVDATTTAMLAFVSSFAHWLADWPMHNADLALYPFSRMHFGYGLWGKLGVGAWVLEAAITAVLCIVASKIVAARPRKVSYGWSVWAVIASLAVQLSPWTSPMWWVATKLDGRTAEVAHGALVAIGFIIPGLVLSRLIEKAEERQAQQKRS